MYLQILSERLQFFRDVEDVFMAAAGVLQQLLTPPGKRTGLSNTGISIPRCSNALGLPLVAH
jgi:hypothetical protein